jgi:hypothetical protein
MTIRKSVTGAFAAALLVTGLGVTAHAWIGQRNTLKFSGSVAVPGAVLPAGSYTFEVVTSGGSADVVRIASTDGRRNYFMGFTRTVERPRNLPENQAIVLGEAKAGTPPPIAGWYPVDGDHGHEFIYR